MCICRAPGCPSARSGHRMVNYKKLLIVFGGFHDNIRYGYLMDQYGYLMHTFSEKMGANCVINRLCMISRHDITRLDCT